MKKFLSLFISGLILFSGINFTVAHALTCTNTFPATLNNYITGQCIPASWGNALEAAIGVTGSNVTSSLEYQVANISSSSILTAITYFSKTTAVFYIDSNRTDTYVANGSSMFPFKTISAAIASSTGYPAYAYILSPGTYVDGAPDVWPSQPFIIQGNESTYVPASGATFPGSFDIFDLTIAGNVIESDNSLTFIHQFNNGVITGNLTLAGLATLSGMAFPTATSSITILAGALVNIEGTNLNNTVVSSGTLNLNDDGVEGSSALPLINSIGGSLNILGATIINTGSGGAIAISNGATSTPNNISSASIVVNSSTIGSTISAGSAATIVCTITQLSNLSGTYIAPTGSNFLPCFDEAHSILGGFSVGTNTVTSNQTTLNQTVNLPLLAANSLLQTNASGSIAATSTVIVRTENGCFGTCFIVAGNNVNITTTTTSTVVNVTNNNTAAGVSGDVQINGGGVFGVNSGVFTYATSTDVLTTNGTTTPTVSANFFISASSTSFSFTGSVASWTVPSNITGNIVLNLKASGGGGSASGQTGDAGGSSTGTIVSAVAGRTYWFLIGQTGNGTSTVVGGGAGAGIFSGTGAGGGGAGMTWWSTTSTFSTSSVLLVSGGGGGGGGFGSTSPSGGKGGGTTGSAGVVSGSATGGGGGTAVSGGTGGTGAGGGASGNNGSAGNGGSGGAGTQCAGGGGGGGFFGGGGGAADNAGLCSGGGGGSGFASSTLSSTSTTQGIGAGAASNGSISLTYTLGNFPTIIGNNNAGQVTMSTSSVTSTISFASPFFVRAPSCYVTPNQSGQTQPAYIVPASTSIAITFNVTMTVNQSFNYFCWPF